MKAARRPALWARPAADRSQSLDLMIASASFFKLSNRCTFKAIFGHEMAPKDAVSRRREAVTEVVLRCVALD